MDELKIYKEYVDNNQAIVEHNFRSEFTFLFEKIIWIICCSVDKIFILVIYIS